MTYFCIFQQLHIIMSDPVSTASAIFGIISFVGQAGKCLRSLRRLQKFNRDRAPQELELLRVELEALDPLIAHVRQVTSAEEPLGDLCADIHRRLVQNSTDLAESRRSSAAGKSILSAVKTTFRTDLRDGIEDAEKALDQLLSLLVILQLKIVEQ